MLILIPLIPMVACGALFVWGRAMGRWAGLVSVGASAASTALALMTVRQVLDGRTLSQSFEWLGIASVPLNWSFTADPLAAVMLLVVTIIGTLIQIFSLGYMSDDPRYGRFFAYMSLFMGSMLGLVLAGNLLVLFVCWELVGLCSYFLIGFWFERDSAANAGKKAFLTTRVGDVGMAIGIWLLFANTGRLDFASFASAAQTMSPGLVTAVALLLFCGAVGKSAQFPLHTWLPDAMEGPTPVSALIHAATMVAAGIYLVARCEPLLAASPTASMVVAGVGVFTALFAATMALVMTDIKKVLAYSTVSQLGYMMLAQGVGAMEAGMFHLVTHATFKALLFLAAGSVIHGCHHEQDMRRMGGLIRTMPVTAGCCLIAVLAICGIPPLSGFWSKDEILLAAWNHGHPVITLIGVGTAGLTAFYMVRLAALTFFGRYRGRHVPHESPLVMTLPLAALALGAVAVGFPGSPLMHHALTSFLAGAPYHPHPVPWLMVVSVGSALVGMITAWARYALRWDPVPAKIQMQWRGVHRLLLNKYGMDELYERRVVFPVFRLAVRGRRFDERVIDGLVNGAGVLGLLLGRLKLWMDQAMVDGAVNGTAGAIRWSGGILRRLQTGFVQHYVFGVVAGGVVIAVTALWGR